MLFVSEDFFSVFFFFNSVEIEWSIKEFNVFPRFLNLVQFQYSFANFGQNWSFGFFFSLVSFYYGCLIFVAIVLILAYSYNLNFRQEKILLFLEIMTNVAIRRNSNQKHHVAQIIPGIKANDVNLCIVVYKSAYVS